MPTGSACPLLRLVFRDLPSKCPSHTDTANTARPSPRGLRQPCYTADGITQPLLPAHAGVTKNCHPWFIPFSGTPLLIQYPDSLPKNLNLAAEKEILENKNFQKFGIFSLQLLSTIFLRQGFPLSFSTSLGNTSHRIRS